jgi:DNA-binding MarR family transcriptional regulator
MELSFAPGIDVGELRKRVGGTTPTIARILAELEKENWVVRPKSDGDGRRRALRLSEAGNRQIDDALASVRKDLTLVYRQAGEPSVSGALELLDAMSEIPTEETRR